MMNPWEQIPLYIYEAHMSLEQVAQLQALNCIMKNQWRASPSAVSAAIFGIAGGNGLEHCGNKLQTIYGFDVNQKYLQACAQRFRSVLGERLQLQQVDLTEQGSKLPVVDLVIADLVIEYIGIKTFCAHVAMVKAKYVSCVIQRQLEPTSFVSASPYQEQFQAVNQLHQDVDPHCLQKEMLQYGYVLVLREISDLPNDKQLLRLDFEKALPVAGE
ncbi:MAG: methyltransferase type 11 [Acutalibacter sp.]|nr:methyltransferase type 11 [Acutalibacter sp.]